jgi:hypothetical protein
VGKHVPLSELARTYGYKDGPSLRRFLTRQDPPVKAKSRQPGRGGQGLYDPAEVQHAIDTRTRPARHDLRSTTMTTTMAYDFGDEIHILELDEAGVTTATDTVCLSMLTTGRDDTLAEAGWHLVGAWSMQGEVEGVEVRQ